uniref:Voltage-dependent T-type calcium channel subunit alpha n=1 Tax=Oncorhynchus mykiss TaxID=8022 RepID=A0A8K9UC73_ONCMY
MTDGGEREPEEEEKERVRVPLPGQRSEGQGQTGEEEEELPYPSLYPVVLFRLSQTSPPRCWCIKARVSMLAILLNCVTLGMFQPCDDVHCLNNRCSFLQVSQKGYLGDTWNRLDFFIVIIGMLEYSLDGHNVSLSAIRTVRVLRPLRAINRVPSMRILVTLLLDTLPMLGNVLALCFFVFFIFGIVGVQLWAGLLRNRIYNVSFLTVYYRPEETEDIPFICSTNRENGMLRCSDVPRRRVDGSWCMLGAEGVGEGPGADGPIGGGCVNWYQYYNVCRAGERNPHKGAINFDNIGYAWIAIFQVITLEGWVDIMYYVMDAHSFYNFIYFIFLIIVGSFFMLNLCLVVIATQFSETKQRENALMRSEQRARYLSNASTLASYQEPGSCYEEILRYIGHLYRKLTRRVARAVTHCSTHTPRCTCWTHTHQHTPKGEVNGLANRHSGHTHGIFHLRPPPLPRPSNCVGVEMSNGGVGRKGRELNYPSIYPHDLYDLTPDPMCVFLVCVCVFSVCVCVCSQCVCVCVLSVCVCSQCVCVCCQRVCSQCVCSQCVCVLSVCVCVVTSLRQLCVLTVWRYLFSEAEHRESLQCPYCVHDDQLCDNDHADFEPSNQRHGNLSPRRGNSLRRVDGQALRPIRDLVVSSRYFNRGIMISILINTLSMGIEFHQQPQELTDILEISNLVFTSLFSLEMLLKLLAFGLFGYIKNPYNGFDSVIVIISVWEIVGQADGGLSVLRTFRLLRVLKLVRFLPALRRQLVVLMKTMDNVATFCMLLMLFIFIFSILGMHLFGCKFGLKLDSGDTLPDRKNFDSLLWAIVTVFQILTQEDWNLVLYNGMASTSPLAALYFVALMTFGNYVLFNLLVAILVEGFQAEVTSMPLPPTQSPWQQPPPPSPRQRPPLILHTLATPTTCDSQSRRGSAVSTDTSNTLDPRSPVSHTHTHTLDQWFSPRGSPWDSRRASWSSIGRGPSLQQRRSQSSERDSLLSDGAGSEWSNPSWGWSREESFDLLDQSEYLTVPMLRPPDCNGKTFHLPDSVCLRVKLVLEPYKPQWCRDHEDWALYLFSPCNRFRQWCQRVITHKMFDHIILLFIFLNCITIALERPDIQTHSTERVFLSVSNHIFTVIFIAEMTVKVVAQGLYSGEAVYLKSSWNVLDGLLVFVSLLDILVSIASAGGNRILGILRVLRLLRTLRPLRVISRAPGLKLVVETLITSLRPIGNIVLICCGFFIVFGILGVQLFKGKFFHCEGVDVRNVTNRTDCLRAGYRWTRRKYNFDNLGQALMSLFVLSSKDGWVSIMYDGLDAVGVDQQPVRNHNPWMLLFFISFLLIVSFFVLNMFVGVVVENFHKCRQDQEEEEAKAREEKRSKRAEKRRRKAQERPYYADYSPVRLTIHTLCTSHYLDLFITVIIATNVLTMSMEHYNQPQYLEEGLKYCNYVFTLVFVIETVLKLIAFGLRRFFKERWNQLDLAIVLLSVMGITLEEIDLNASLPINPTIIRIMRVLRIARVLKLLKMATGMRALLDTVVQALPQVGNLGLLFMLLFFIYAALGVELFGKLECSEENPCEGLSRHATFQNFGMAFLTLFRVSTGDNWNGIMKDTLRDCRPEDRSCLSYLPLVSPVYFVTFVLTAQFVLVNVVVAVLMKHLEESNKEAQEEAEEEAKEEEARQEEARQQEARQEEARQEAISTATCSAPYSLSDTPATLPLATTPTRDAVSQVTIPQSSVSARSQSSISQSHRSPSSISQSSISQSSISQSFRSPSSISRISIPQYSISQCSRSQCSISRISISQYSISQCSRSQCSISQSSRSQSSISQSSRSQRSISQIYRSRSSISLSSISRSSISRSSISQGSRSQGSRSQSSRCQSSRSLSLCLLGSVYSMGSSGAGSLLQVPGALPSGSHASLSSRGSSCRPTVRLSPSHSVDRHSLSMARHTPRRPGHVDSRRASYIHSPSHSMDTHSYRLSPAQSIDRDSSRYLDRRASYIHSPSHSMDSRHTPYLHSPSHSMDSRHTPRMDRHTPYIHSPSHSMDSRHTLYIHSPSHSMDSRHTPYVNSPAHSINRHTPHNNRHTSHMSRPSHSMDREPGPSSSLSVRRQLRRQVCRLQLLPRWHINFPGCSANVCFWNLACKLLECFVLAGNFTVQARSSC